MMVSVMTWPVTVITDVIGVGIHFDEGLWVGVGEVAEIAEVVAGVVVELDELDVSKAIGIG